MFFGGGGRRGRTGPQKGEDIVHPLKVSLEDLYNGKTVRLAINRNKLCLECDGRGGKAGAERACQECGGRGVRIQLRQIGPGMVQQMQSACGSCGGEGRVMDEKDKCKSCKGKKVYKDRKVLEVVVEKGMKHGQKIKFADEADELPGTIPGDVVFVVQEKEHEQFKRKGADLIFTMEIKLTESLCGFVRTITHLDGRVLSIESKPGEIVKPESVKAIQGEGMPYHGSPFTKGRLFIHFRVEFPRTLPMATVNAIRAALPAAPKVVLSGEEEECHMVDVDISHFGQNDGRGHDDEEEDERGGAQRVQCNNM